MYLSVFCIVQISLLSVQHTLASKAGEPAVKWMNSTTNWTFISYDFDGLCDVVLTLDPPALIFAWYVINGTTIDVILEERPTTVFGVYTVNLAPFRLSRTWADYNSTVFYGEEVRGLMVWLRNSCLESLDVDLCGGIVLQPQFISTVYTYRRAKLELDVT